MKRSFFFCAALVLALYGIAGAGQPVSSKITDVTLFTDKAQVTRSASANVDPGVKRLVIPTDAFSVESDSVTAAISGEGEILGVYVTRAPLAEMPQEKIRELENHRDELVREKQALTDKITAFSKQEAFLNAVVDFSRTQVPAEIKTQMPSINSLNETLSFLGERFNAVLDQKRTVEKQVSAQDKKTEQVKRELDMIRGGSTQTRTGIEILFNSAKKQSIAMEVRYMTPRAGWSPVYRASVNDALDGVELSMMAEIVQKTGEDWTDATLSVSNALPATGGRLPDLPAWWLDYPQWLNKARAPQAMAERAMESKMDAAGAPMAKMAQAQVRQTALSFEYTLPMPVSVASRDQQTLLPIFTKTLDGNFYHYAVPKADSRAYLVCEAEADSELLAGPVNIFFEGRYVGQMYLEEKISGNPFTLGLGMDRAVTVKREKIRDKRQETAFFGKIERDTIVREIDYRITAENMKNRPVKLHLVDHLPVSRTDRITVKDIRITPEPQKRDIGDKQGVMQWNMDLAPGKTSTVSISFTVTYPKEMPPPMF